MKKVEDESSKTNNKKSGKWVVTVQQARAAQEVSIVNAGLTVASCRDWIFRYSLMWLARSGSIFGRCWFIRKGGWGVCIPESNPRVSLSVAVTRSGPHSLPARTIVLRGRKSSSISRTVLKRSQKRPGRKREASLIKHMLEIQNWELRRCEKESGGENGIYGSEKGVPIQLSNIKDVPAAIKI